MATAAETMAAWAAGLRPDDVPGEVLEAAVLHLADTVSCGLAAHSLGIATAAREVVVESGGRPEATVIGGAAKLPAPATAFANGMLCHGLDFDDTHPDSVCHVSAAVVPAALAAAEAAGASGREALAAQIAGSEIVIRIGMAATGAFHARGFHPTSVAGVFGATAAAARLFGCDARQMTNALGIAGSLASGIFEYLADGSATKPIHAGWAAQAGITAARLAARGATGPASVLEGRYGLFATFADRHGIDLGGALTDLGRRWETKRIAFKPYPACHFIHAPLDAALAALGGRKLDPADVRDILVRIPDAGVPLVLEPLAEKHAPRTAYDAKFSLPFSLAALLVDGTVGVATYKEEKVRDPRLLALAARVRYERKEFATFPRSYPGDVEISLDDGTKLSGSVPHQRGGDGNPMSAADVREKLRANAALALSAADATQFEEGLIAIADAANLSAVLAPLSRARA